MNKEQFLLQKYFSITDVAVNAANQTIKFLKIAYPKKIIFPKRDRRPKKRIEKIYARTNILLTPFISAAQISMIIAQPIPRFKPGANALPGIAIANENGIEIIQTTNGTIPTFSNKQAPKPKRNRSDT